VQECKKGGRALEQGDLVTALQHLETCLTLIPEGERYYTYRINCMRLIDSIVLNHVMPGELAKQREEDYRPSLQPNQRLVPDDSVFREASHSHLSHVLVTPVLSASECEWIMEEAETVGDFRPRMNYNTSDQDLQQLRRVVAWMKQPGGVRQRLLELLREQFQIKGDVELELKESNIVRYTNETNMIGYRVHNDGKDLLTFNILLSKRDAFGGGGTWIAHLQRTVYPEQGSMLTYHGDTYHTGEPISWGRRYVWQGFVRVPSGLWPAERNDARVELVQKAISVHSNVSFHPQRVDMSNMHAYLGTLLSSSSRDKEALHAWQTEILISRHLGEPGCLPTWLSCITGSGKTLKRGN